MRFFLVVALFGLGLGCTQPAPPPTDPRVEIEALLEDQAKAWNKGRIPDFMSAYEQSKDLIFTSGGNVRRGFRETLNKYQKTYGEKDLMGHLEFEILDLRMLNPSAAIVLGTWELTKTEKEGKGVFTLVMIRESKGWKIIHDHTSVGPKENGE